MDSNRRAYLLRDLDASAIEVLRSGRVPWEALAEALRRRELDRKLSMGDMMGVSNILSDMIDAARSPRCWACGEPSDMQDPTGEKKPWCYKCYNELRRTEK